MKEFFKHYQIGCWHYRTTSYDLNYNPIEAQKDLGMTFATMPEHIHYDKTGFEEAQLDKFMASAKELGLPALYIDRRFMHNRKWAKPSLEKAKERLLYVKERYGDTIGGIYICDEPWWGYQDEHKAMDNCRDYVQVVRDNAPEYWTYIALLGVHDRYEKARATLDDYVNTVHPDFLLYNVYSQLLAENFEVEQGVVNFYHQLYMYYETSRKYNIPLWASPMCTACWSFREPNQNEYRWQLNVMAAHGVKGFVWYHLQENQANPGQQSAGAPIDGFDEKTKSYAWLKHENKAFMRSVAEKLDSFELQEVYHWMFRYGNFKSFEYEKDEYIEDVRSLYNRHMIISRFADKDGRQRVMIVNGSQNENGNFSIKFRGEYAKYNISGEGGFLAPGGMRIIDLFDTPEDPKWEIKD